MDYIDQILDQLRDWAQQLIDILLGPDGQPEAELVPIPVEDRYRRRS